MGTKIRAAFIAVTASLVAFAGVASAQAAEPTGYVGGIVFEDLNDDGVWQDGEPGISDVNVVVTDADGVSADFPTSSYGVWTMKRAPYGWYQVSFSDPEFVNISDSTVLVEIGDDELPSVNFAVRRA